MENQFETATQLSLPESHRLYLNQRFKVFLNILEAKNPDNLSESVIATLLEKIEEEPSLIENDLNWFQFAVEYLNKEKISTFISRPFLINLHLNQESPKVDKRVEIEELFAMFVDRFIEANEEINLFPTDEYCYEMFSTQVGAETLQIELPAFSELIDRREQWKLLVNKYTPG